MTNFTSTWRGPAALTFLLIAPASCGSRNPDYSTPLGEVDAVPLSGSIALFDRGLERISFLTSPRAFELGFESIPAPENVQQLVPSVDQTRLFVLSAGVDPRLTPDDEGPQLLVFDGAADAEVSERIVKRFRTR